MYKKLEKKNKPKSQKIENRKKFKKVNINGENTKNAQKLAKEWLGDQNIQGWKIWQSNMDW